MLSEGGDPRKIVEARGLKQVTDTGAIEKIVDEIIAANPEKAEQARAKPAMLGWFVGQVDEGEPGQGQPAGGQRAAQGKTRDRVKPGACSAVSDAYPDFGPSQRRLFRCASFWFFSPSSDFRPRRRLQRRGPRRDPEDDRAAAAGVSARRRRDRLFLRRAHHQVDVSDAWNLSWRWSGKAIRRSIGRAAMRSAS